MEGILRTKTAIPAAVRGAIARRRLLERLDGGHRDLPRLTLVAAPPGSGKTTAVSQWAAALDAGVAWLTVDGSDNEPFRLLRHLYAALAGSFPELQFWIPVGLRLPPASSLALSLALSFEEIGQEMVVIIDDYHLIRNAYIHDVLNTLLRNLPEKLHLVVLSREDPPLKSARLQVEGRLTQIRQEDLAFTAAEIDTLAESRGIEPKDYDFASELQHRTEGWAVAVVLGLDLVARSHGRADFEELSRSRRHLVDYFVQEVLDALEEETAAFLIDVSILERLSPAVCAGLTGRSDAGDTLGALERRHLFVSLVEETAPIFRLHPLFAEFLRTRLPEDRRTALHERAVDLVSSPGEALYHARQTGNAAVVMRTLRGMLPRILTAGALGTLRQWLTEEDALVAGDPHLSLILRELDLVIVGADRDRDPTDSPGDFVNRWRSLSSSGNVLSGPSWEPEDTLSSILLAVLESGEAFVRDESAATIRDARRALKRSQEAKAPVLSATCLVWLVHVLLEFRDISTAEDALATGLESLPGPRDLRVTVSDIVRPDVYLRQGSRSPEELAGAIASARQALTTMGLHFVLPIRPATWLRRAAESIGDTALAESFLPYLPAATLSGTTPPATGPREGAPPVRSLRPDDLTRRELEVLRLVAQGLRNAEVAEQLFISVGTVKWHVINILQKLDAGSRTQAVLRARESGILD